MHKHEKVTSSTKILESIMYRILKGIAKEAAGIKRGKSVPRNEGYEYPLRRPMMASTKRLNNKHGREKFEKLGRAEYLFPK